MSKSIDELITDLQKELAQTQRELQTLSSNRRKAESAEHKAMNKQRELAREIEALQEAKEKLQGV